MVSTKCTSEELKKIESALASYDKAIQIKPDYAEAYNNRGNVLLELKKIESAIESFDRAIQIKPNYAEAYTNHMHFSWQCKL